MEKDNGRPGDERWVWVGILAGVCVNVFGLAQRRPASERLEALVRSMASLQCKNKYPKGVFGHEARQHYTEARQIALCLGPLNKESGRDVNP